VRPARFLGCLLAFKDFLLFMFLGLAVVLEQENCVKKLENERREKQIKYCKYICVQRSYCPRQTVKKKEDCYTCTHFSLSTFYILTWQEPHHNSTTVSFYFSNPVSRVSPALLHLPSPSHLRLKATHRRPSKPNLRAPVTTLPNLQRSQICFSDPLNPRECTSWVTTGDEPRSRAPVGQPSRSQAPRTSSS
jgi:hypothetical protein